MIDRCTNRQVGQQIPDAEIEQQHADAVPSLVVFMETHCIGCCKHLPTIYTHLPVEETTSGSLAYMHS